MQRGPQHKQWSHDGLALDLSPYVRRDKAAGADLTGLHKVFLD
jgi:hypothetical protein